MKFLVLMISPIAGSSNVFEVLFKTLTLTFIIIMSYK
ncbi:unnamed protein product, partial [Brassica napus]